MTAGQSSVLVHQPIATAAEGSSDARARTRAYFKRLVESLSAALMIPLLVPFAFTTERRVIRRDVERWMEALHSQTHGPVRDLLILLAGLREYRNLYFHRLRHGNIAGALLSACFSWLYRGQSALFIACPHVGPGLFVQHGFSTIIAARSVGSNCWINQQVTIGFNREGNPILGNNVHVSAGAKVIGPVTIGNNVKIGANAVVLKDVPDDCVVVGVPAYIVRRKGVKVQEPL